MARFSEAGNDMYICQVCARDLDSVKHPPVWRPDLTGHESAGNVCPECVKRREDKPLSLFEHCKLESGLSNHNDIVKYMNRYYGNG